MLYRPKERGFHIGCKFNQSNWDKNDFFSPDGTALIFCTEKVINLIHKYKITNSEVKNINEVENYSFGED
jgi:hypothetical protein